MPYQNQHIVSLYRFSTGTVIRWRGIMLLSSQTVIVGVDWRSRLYTFLRDLLDDPLSVFAVS